MDDDIVDRLEDIVKTATLGSSGGKDSSLAVPRAVTLEKYRRRLSMYQLNDGVLGADEMDALKDEFGKEGITVIEHDTLLAEIISKADAYTNLHVLLPNLHTFRRWKPYTLLTCKFNLHNDKPKLKINIEFNPKNTPLNKQTNTTQTIII